MIFHKLYTPGYNNGGYIPFHRSHSIKYIYFVFRYGHIVLYHYPSGLFLDCTDRRVYYYSSRNYL